MARRDAGGNITWIDFKRIDIGQRIGEGAFGTVFKAILDGTEQVAVKRLENPDQKKINREIFQLLELDHPNIIKIHGASRDEDNIYLVMELADNGSLNDAIHGSSSKQGYNRQVISWGLQCARAVAYLHSKDYIHRDLKPDNCLLFQDETVLKICDFGIARKVLPRGDMTATGGVELLTQIGPRGYLAPEVYEGPDYDGKKCDVYSWAITMGELLTGMKPYPENKVVKERVSGEPTGLYNFLQRCWADDPSKRPPMSEVVKKMETFDSKLKQ